MDEALIFERIRIHAGDTGRDLHIDTPLTNLTIGYRPVGLIADQIYPIVPVTKQNDFYYVWPRQEWLRVRNAEGPSDSPIVILLNPCTVIVACSLSCGLFCRIPT